RRFSLSSKAAHRGREHRACRAQSRISRAYSNSEAAGDLRHRYLVEIVEHEYRALFEIDFGQRKMDHAARSFALQRVIRRSARGECIIDALGQDLVAMPGEAPMLGRHAHRERK